MLKNIRLHIDSDEEKQKNLDESLARIILETHGKNINSFERNIPSLLKQVKSPKLQNHSLFYNVFGEVNIVDYGIGRTLYGFHPRQEVKEQVEEFLTHAPKISLLEDNKSLTSFHVEANKSLTHSKGYLSRMSYSSLPESIDCLVVLGCGLGIHLVELIKARKIKYLIVYEPEIQYFQCSILITKWHEIFDIAKRNKTQLFLQIEKDSRSLVADIDELTQYDDIHHFYLYKHYNHPVFNNVFKNLTQKQWSTIKERGVTYELSDNYKNYVPPWTPNINIANYTDCNSKASIFTNNLLAFKKFFPDIYREFKDYKPEIWLPIQNDRGDVNVVQSDSMTPWYSDNSREDCAINFENYSQQPHKDGLILGYRGTKLAHYLHYKFVKETEELLKEAQNEAGILPENIASIIVFGIGVGYQLETLVNQHSVEKLFVCEPNRDFFYSSLFAIDWRAILEKIDATNARLYINVGDEGSHLFKELLNQFHSIGPYILNNTYFYQSYYNASLNSSIAQLREQLQIVISMGEYFDHAYYGIAHTKAGFNRDLPILGNSPSSKLTYEDKEVPVFIVGNGPSLDMSIDTIKTFKEQVIVVSCGTALQALRRHGITPDFHAEIEQNRTTFDWAVLIEDRQYLKNITLISCNGIHPDTCELYKDVMIAFKEGESSTVSALNILGTENFEVLQHAFPTVSNFATNLVTVLGFNNIYFMGVDLGFFDIKHHHSKSSGYYQEDGNETYDYAKKNNTSLIVPGNFRPTVNTKHEFKLSKQIIEQVIHRSSKRQEFFNCSDGAKIIGATPLSLDNLIVISSTKQKQDSLKRLKFSVFTTEFNKNFIGRFEAKYSNQIMEKELDKLIDRLNQKVDSIKQANHLINYQKELLFSSYKKGNSLLFYYLYGTINYANAVLTKLVNNGSEEQSLSCSFNDAKDAWLKAFEEISCLLSLRRQDDFDSSSFQPMLRELKSLKHNYRQSSILFVSNSPSFRACIEFIIEKQLPWIEQVDILSFNDALELKREPDYIIYDHISPSEIVKKGNKYTIAILSHSAEVSASYHDICYMLVTEIENASTYLGPVLLAQAATFACLSEQNYDLIVPKHIALEGTKLSNCDVDIPLENYQAYDNLLYVGVHARPVASQPLNLHNNESRTKIIIGKLRCKHLLYKFMNEDELETYQHKVRNIVCN
ncbi:MAG: hypothetical protein Alis3KO_21140 [Aliiglaciecola sp.]